MDKPLSPVKILEIISKQVNPLNPPVKSFEKSIRTSPFRILISVMLSARTKDQVTMEASKRLFNIADSPEKIVKLDINRIKELIYPVGFFKQKSINILKISEIVLKNGGEIPKSFEELTSLPGIGRKTANLVLALAFNIQSIAVDIHVFRISKRLGWAHSETPDKVESELKHLFPESSWSSLNQILVGFGQTICKPRNPSCSICNISSYCHYSKEKNSSINRAD